VFAKLAKKKGIESYVVTAIPVGAARVFIAFNVVDRDGTFIGSAVIDVDITTMAAKLVYESELSLIDYVVELDRLLASSCGSFVYFFDGKRWTRVRVNPNPKKLVERLKLDF
jgi:hypothetical protein